MINRERIRQANKKAIRRIAHLGSEPFCGCVDINGNDISFEEYIYHQMCLHRNTTKLCSCYMCGNPRRYFGELPRQWLRENERYRQAVKEELAYE